MLNAQLDPKAPQVGTVTEFDDPRGLGTITAADGATYPFHCTQIADGSRTIDVGRDVRFELLAKLGRYEAAAIEPVRTEPPSEPDRGG